jgi:hypothetical protein
MKDLKNILLMLLGVTVVSMYFYYSNKMVGIQQTQKQLSDFSANVQMNGDFYELNFDLGNSMTGLKAPEVKTTLHGDNDMFLSEIVKSGPILLFRYADINCNTCYESAIAEMKKTFSDSVRYVAILCSYYAERDFHVFKKVNRIKYPMYRVQADAFDWAIEDYSTPYYFVLHPDMKVSNIYVPSNSYPEKNKLYLESIKRLLSE